MCVRQPRVQWEDRHLDREPEEERQKHPPLEGSGKAAVDELQHIERATLRVKVEREDPDQHHYGAQHRVEEELHGRIRSALASPYRDQEVHRDQNEFPEHVEEHEVECHEDAVGANSQEQDHGEIELGPLAYLPACYHGEEREQGREAHEEC